MSDAQRPETGPLQFGEDWPGVFIRGDQAGHLALVLGEILDDPGCLNSEYITTRAPLEQLRSLLAGSRVWDGQDPPELTKLRPYPECLPR